jgi:N-acyl homoserine lactone hydrolase
VIEPNAILGVCSVRHRDRRGHVPGHQSLVVDTTSARIVIGGQAFNEASASARQFAWTLQAEGVDEPLPDIPDWTGRLQQFDPRRVVFAHDLAVWESDRAIPQ